MMEIRGLNRRLTTSDFTAQKIFLFTPSDFGPTWQQMHAVVAYRLQDFLISIPHRFKITSAHRTPATNRAAGGSKNSRHMTGDATDVWITDPDFFERKTLETRVALARAAGFNGVGLYKGQKFFHLDVRPTPWLFGAERAAGKLKFFPKSEIFARIAAPVAGVGVLLLVAFLIVRSIRA